MNVIPYRPDFSSDVLRLILEIQREEFSIDIAAAQQPDLLDIAGFYQVRDGNFWVALADELVVGTISLLDIGNGQAALRKMFVHRAYRGHEVGTAKRLLAALLGWARDRGVREIFLGTTPKFLAAHRFYEKNGFTEIPPADLPPAFPIMAVDKKFYRRVVDAGE
jgi:GNAT superfamily N-acetyltransferase